MTFEIHLKKYDTRHTFSKELFLSAFPKSMIAHAFELDPETKIIEIDHPDVIPEAIEALNIFVDGEASPFIRISSQFAQSGKYLCIDLLKIMALPGWDQFIQKYDPSMLVDLDRIVSAYKELLIFCREQMMYDLIAYLHEIVPADIPVVVRSDLKIVIEAILECNRDLVKLYLDRIDWSSSITFTIDNTYILMAEEDWKAMGSNPLVKLAMTVYNTDIYELILKNGKIQDTDESILDRCMKSFDGCIIPTLSYITYPIETIYSALRILQADIRAAPYLYPIIKELAPILREKYNGMVKIQVREFEPEDFEECNNLIS